MKTIRKPKFEMFQNVIVTGEFTGMDDMKGVIYEIEFFELDDSFYYVVSCSGTRFYIKEKFLTL